MLQEIFFGGEQVKNAILDERTRRYSKRNWMFAGTAESCMMPQEQGRGFGGVWGK